MKNFAKSLISAAVIAGFSAMPLAASAYSIGVTDSAASSIMSGHFDSTTNSNSNTWQNSQAQSTAWKIGSENDNSNTNGYVVDPAATNQTITGNYSVGSITNTQGQSGSSSNTNSVSHITGAQEVDTLNSVTVGTFYNP